MCIVLRYPRKYISLRESIRVFLSATKDDFDPRQTRMLMQDTFDDDNRTFSLRLLQFLE